jgi:hypothetical protein
MGKFPVFAYASQVFRISTYFANNLPMRWQADRAGEVASEIGAVCAHPSGKRQLTFSIRIFVCRERVFLRIGPRQNRRQTNRFLTFKISRIYRFGRKLIQNEYSGAIFRPWTRGKS